MSLARLFLFRLWATLTLTTAIAMSIHFVIPLKGYCRIVGSLYLEASFFW